jgi:hypothetical protein
VSNILLSLLMQLFLLLLLLLGGHGMLLWQGQRLVGLPRIIALVWHDLVQFALFCS